MPRPVYILCSRSGAEDKVTGLLSHYHVLERISFTSPMPDQPNVSFCLRVTAVWMREEGDDPEQGYEFQFVLRFPPGGEESIVAEGTFRFSHPLHRMIVDTPIARFGGPGLFRVENRIRPVGTEGWSTQHYPILLDLVQFARDGATPP